MIKKQFLKTIEENNLISEGDHIIIGFSGGPDSYALLMLLLDIAKDKKLTIYTAHLNHQFRAEQADKDEEVVAKISRDLGLKHFSKKVDCIDLAKKLNISSEDAGRRARYEFFREVEKEIKKEIEKEAKENSIKVAIGQNANDQVETMIFRFMRGSSIDGLGGIKYESINEYGSKVIRPILDILRRDIENFCYEKNLKPLMDKTNDKEVYTRNKIRLNLIPHIEKELNVNIQNSILSLNRLVNRDVKFIWNEVDKAYNESIIDKTESRISLDLNQLKKYEYSIWSRLIVKCLRELGSDKDIRSSHIEAVGSLFDTEEGSKIVQLPNESLVSVGYGLVNVIKEKEAKDYNVHIEIKELSQLSDLNFSRNMSPKEDEDKVVARLCFDLDKFMVQHSLQEDDIKIDLNKKIILRKRREGDFLRLKEDLGRKKLKKIFIDNKVLKADRDKINLIAYGSEILWIDLYRTKKVKSGKYIVDDHSKRLIYIEITK